MFLVSHSLEWRARVVRDFLDKHASVALVVAAAYFEWTLCRALVALSRRPNKELREALGSVYGLQKYKDFWWAEQQDQPSSRRLPEVVADWDAVTRAFDARNRLVHGRDRFTRNLASPHVETLLGAVRGIHKYAESRGVDLGQRLRVRKKMLEGGSHESAATPPAQAAKIGT